MSIDTNEPTLRRVHSRRAFLLAGSTSLAVAATEISFPHIPFDTEPHNIRDSTLWRILRGPGGGVMALCGAGDKYSNYWQWSKSEKPSTKPSALLKGNFRTYVREDLAGNVRMSCDGIDEIYLLTPHKEAIWRLMFQTVKELTPGLYQPYEQEVNLFSGKLSGPIKFLRGNGDVLIYSTDEKCKPISLTATGPFPRHDPTIQGRLI